MIVIIECGNKNYKADLTQPLDISLPLRSGDENPNAFGIQHPRFEPFRAGPFVGSVELGGSANCENLLINAHGNGTHTECVGHISKERITINNTLKQFFCIARVVSVEPENNIITKSGLAKFPVSDAEALVIRTLPNDKEKRTRKYSGTNPTYLAPEVSIWMREQGIRHLLIDLPSVDAEEDNGVLAAHHAFWNYPDAPRLDATITELIFVDDSVKDGLYLLNMQIAPVESDASPAKPVLYNLQEMSEHKVILDKSK